METIPYPKVSLIDLDHMIYTCAILRDKADDDIELTRYYLIERINGLKDIIYSVFPTVKKHILFVGGSKNFRKSIRAEKPYKGNRPEKPLCYDLLVMEAKRNGAISYEFLEADDMTAMYHHHSHVTKTYKTVLVDQDKDLNQVAGWRIVPPLVRNGETVREVAGFFISHEEAYRSFYKQLLMGDDTDNICGLRGIGQKKADVILSKCASEYECWDAVVNEYMKSDNHVGLSQATIISKLISRATLLYMKRRKEDVFIPPFEN